MANLNENHEDSNLELKSTLVSRNITVNSRRTSVRLEPEMWAALSEIAKREQSSIHDICTLINFRKKSKTSLTAAIRVFIMLYFRAASTENGHQKAGHGNIRHMRERAGIREHKPHFSGFKPKVRDPIAPFLPQESKQQDIISA